MQLDKAAKIRLVFFILIIIWAMYLSIGFAYEFCIRGVDSTTFVDTSDVKDIYVDGSDVTWAVKLLGYGVNGMLAALFIFIGFIYLALEAVTVLVPVLILRFVGLRKKYDVHEDEYRLTRYIFYASIGICLITGLIILRFLGIIPLIVYTLVWALIVLIYVLGVKNRVHENEEIA